MEVEMRPKRSMGLLMTVALAACSGSTGGSVPPSVVASAAPTAAASFGPAAAVVEAHGETPTSFFSPKTIDIKAGESVRVVDVGDTEHDFTIDVGGKVPTKPADQHIAVQIKVDLLSTTNQAPINLPPGTYMFYCSVSLGNGAGHAVNGMVGTITIH
jgi:plastocyanin